MQSARVPWMAFVLLALLSGGTPAVRAQIPEQLRVSPPAPTTQDSVQLIYEGEWSNGCTPQAEWVTRQGSLIHFATANRGEFCTLAITPFRATATLGRLSPGSYIAVVTFNGRERKQVAFTVSGSSRPEPPAGDTYESLQREWEVAPPVGSLSYRYRDDDGWGTLDIKAWKAPGERFLGSRFVVRLQQGGRTFYGRGEGISWDIVAGTDRIQFFLLSRSGWRFEFEGQLTRPKPDDLVFDWLGDGSYRDPYGQKFRWMVFPP